MSENAEKPETTQNQLKKRLLTSWDHMKKRYPVVRSMERVQGDAVKEEFLRSIDGLKSAEEIGDYFTLEPSEAHLIFSDLLQLGAIRFLEVTERLGYLRKQNLELKKQFDFQMAERSRLIGEEIYLSERLKEKKKAMAELTERISGLSKSLEMQELTLARLHQKHKELWATNSELLSVGKDTKGKEQQIKQAIEMLEAEFPKLLKKKIRVIEKLKKTEEAQNRYALRNDHLDKKLLAYQETVDEMRDYLEEAKLRVTHLIKDK